MMSDFFFFFFICSVDDDHQRRRMSFTLQTFLLFPSFFFPLFWSLPFENVITETQCKR